MAGLVSNVIGKLTGIGQTVVSPERTEPTFVKPEPSAVPVINVEDMKAYYGSRGDERYGYGWAGSKFTGGLSPSFGFNDDYEIVDLELLRRRSQELFQRNIYAAGLIRRLVTNEINKGLRPQAMISPRITGLSQDQASDWSDEVEELFAVYSNDPMQVDYMREKPLGVIEADVRRMALILGDVVVVERMRMGVPSYQIIPGTQIQQPIKGVADTNIRHGVKVDAKGRHVSYFHTDHKTGKTTEIPARGRRSGRRTAWMVYGTEQRVDTVRGMPMMAIIIQSLKEIDTYRDAESRAAVVNAMIATYLSREKDGISSGTFSSGAVRRETIIEETNEAGPRTYNFHEFHPGMVISELQPGEKPESFDTKRPNVNYAAFETAMLSAIAWAHEMPPEVLMQQFGNNYSASKAAVAEFNMYLDRVRMLQASQFNQRIYESWLLSQVQFNRVEAPGFFEASRDPNQRYLYAAWIAASWIGAIKPSVDLKKDVDAYKIAIEEGLITREKVASILFGGSFRVNVATLTSENDKLVQANRSVVELNQPAAASVADDDSDDDASDETGDEENNDDD